MKKLVKAFVFLAIIAACIISEDYIARGMGVVIGVITVILAFIIGDSNEKREDYSTFLFGIGYVFGLVFLLLSTLVEVHVEEDKGNRVRIHSRYFTHIIAEGTKFESKKIRYGYRTEYAYVQGVEVGVFYFVYRDKMYCM